jgi:dipeptidyl-peptidase 4
MDETSALAARTIERVRASDGARRPAVDAAAALASLAALSPGEAPKSLPWPEALDPAGATAVYTFGDDLYALDLASSRFSRLTATPAKESLPRFSPDGRRLAFVRDNDLWTIELATKRESRLTSDGGESVLNGTLSWVYWEEIFDRDDTGHWWSPDSKSIAFLRTDESGVDVSTFTDFAPAVPRVIRQRYPRTGGVNPSVRLGIVGPDGGGTVWMDRAGVPYEFLVGVDWLPDGRNLAVQAADRSQTRVDVWRFDRVSGQASRVVSESDPAFVYQKEIEFLDGGKTWILSSIVDGQIHLVRYGMDGARQNTVTRGPWSVRRGTFYSAPVGSAFVDQPRGLVYFTAIEKSPLESHLYRIRPDGTGMVRITQEDGIHRVTPSPDVRFYVDAWSSANTPPALALHDISGRRVAELSKNRTDLLAPFGLSKREFVSIDAPDGFPIPASLLKPPGFDPSKKYPVLMHVYGGPGSPIVLNRWAREELFDHPSPRTATSSRPSIRGAPRAGERSSKTSSSRR